MNLTACYAPAARKDFYECAEYFEERDASVADRFRESVRETVELLCGNSELGECFRRDLTGTIRFRGILKFSNYLIFYRREDSNLQILRIIHGARDYEKMFD
jgi:toxin ParE1/3/4